jgi:hypothetical protein
MLNGQEIIMPCSRSVDHILFDGAPEFYGKTNMTQSDIPKLSKNAHTV